VIFKKYIVQVKISLSDLNDDDPPDILTTVTVNMPLLHTIRGICHDLQAQNVPKCTQTVEFFNLNSVQIPALRFKSSH